MTDIQKKKRKLRSSAKWKKKRNYLKKLYNNTDPITLKPLYKGFQVHHLDLNPEHYEVLEDEVLVPLNRLTHTVLHWIYEYYKTDKDVILRLKHYLDLMVQINNDKLKENKTDEQ